MLMERFESTLFTLYLFSLYTEFEINFENFNVKFKEKSKYLVKNTKKF